jgi:hypothetical protein
VRRFPYGKRDARQAADGFFAKERPKDREIARIYALVIPTTTKRCSTPSSMQAPGHALALRERGEGLLAVVAAIGGIPGDRRDLERVVGDHGERKVVAGSNLPRLRSGCDYARDQRAIEEYAGHPVPEHPVRDQASRVESTPPEYDTRAEPRRSISSLSRQQLVCRLSGATVYGLMADQSPPSYAYAAGNGRKPVAADPYKSPMNPAFGL